MIIDQTSVDVLVRILTMNLNATKCPTRCGIIPDVPVNVEMSPIVHLEQYSVTLPAGKINIQITLCIYLHVLAVYAQGGQDSG